ncbi:cytochrome P450 family protein [Pleurotus pulmonarius]
MLSVHILFLFTTSFVILGYLRKRHRRTPPLPPGPKRYPIIGNLKVPDRDQWIVYDRIAKEHNSDIIHLCTFGNSVIVLNSYEVATNLLHRRSSISSSRPAATMLTEVMGWKPLFSIQQYGQEWRDRRRELIRRLHESPLEFQEHVRHMIGASILAIVYGLDAQEKDDPYIKMYDNAQNHLKLSFIGSYMVDTFPILRHIPRWMPGAGFKIMGENATHDMNLLIEAPYSETRKLLAEGRAESTFVHRTLCRGAISSGGQEECVLKDAAAAAYFGAVETSQFPMTIFFAIMAHNPDVQARAQEELDQYLGHRLPDFDDQPHLPYICALMLETLRWEPMGPLGLAHSLDSDDEFEEYHLPKGSIVFYNVWAILRDETLFPEPNKFNPSRFLKNGVIDTQLRDRVMSSFGFGRRICPGRYFALDTLWLSMASILSAYTISKAVDENGREIEINLQYTADLNRHVLPFKCLIKPRSQQAEEIIHKCCQL